MHASRKVSYSCCLSLTTARPPARPKTHARARACEQQGEPREPVVGARRRFFFTFVLLQRIVARNGVGATRGRRHHPPREVAADAGETCKRRGCVAWHSPPEPIIRNLQEKRVRCLALSYRANHKNLLDFSERASSAFHLASCADCKRAQSCLLQRKTPARLRS